MPVIHHPDGWGDEQVKVHFTPASIATFLKGREQRKEEPKLMQVADTSSTDDGFTILESGQELTHHTKSTCQAPCVLHSPIDGPWAEWPRFYWEPRNIIYRVCPHNMAHPAVEQAVYLVKTGTAQRIAHKCCNECVCMPRATLPDSLFHGDFIPVPLTLLNWAHIPVEQPENVEEDSGDKPASGGIKDPNAWAADCLDRYLKLNISIPLDFYNLLRISMLDESNGHYIHDVHGNHNDTAFNVECQDECNVVLRKNDAGKWVNTSESWCPPIEIALFAGWVPTEWSMDDDDDEVDY